jgi:hypothetical protein
MMNSNGNQTASEQVGLSWSRQNARHEKAHQAQFDRLAGIDERSLGLLSSLGTDKQRAQEREQQGDAKDAHG